eukprot:Lithocolla_globosa_v1_NODE_237_length_4940_cov_56.687001.p3 type:complete len:251 gc:universal NODE_237_length_4940_cov_56.687001:4112-4864(+)
MKGSEAKQAEVRAKISAEDYCHFLQVYTSKRNHTRRDTTRSALYMLLCYQPLCPHPSCTKFQALLVLSQIPPTVPHHNRRWFEGGPLLSSLLFPIPKSEPSTEACTRCPLGALRCAGHYYVGRELWLHLQSHEVGSPELRLPSSVLQTALQKEIKEDICASDQVIKALAQRVLLREEQVRHFLEHEQDVHRHRVAGAKKGAETRKRNAEKINSSATQSVNQTVMETETETEAGVDPRNNKRVKIGNQNRS